MTPTDAELDQLVDEARADALSTVQSLGAPTAQGSKILRLLDALTAERARVAELEAENAKLREPDMFWDADDPETGGRDEYEHAEERGFCPTVMELMCARSLRNFWMAATCDEDDDWTITRHATKAEAETACAARAALTAHTEAREEPHE